MLNEISIFTSIKVPSSIKICKCITDNYPTLWCVDSIRGVNDSIVDHGKWFQKVVNRIVVPNVLIVVLNTLTNQIEPIII